ncbi:histone-lysine N-methyltransferase PRDM9 [Ictalurus punctatus]|uniref:Histone-lysine N-methyltransferase PRDM9 n=1 Tax=Ictalurus punctatus TaxID=7998 RepID=A0A9F7RDT7_ICTPU|nr:histone-lysine N-methyltransferase PRDM9 [Ictalurus punctatus]
MQTDVCSTSDGRTSSSVGHVASVDQQNREPWKKPLKEEETDEDEDEDYFYGGTCSSVKDAEDHQNAEFQILIKEEEPEHDDILYCEDCRSFFINKCEVHGPALFIPDIAVPLGVADRARQTLPPGLEIRKSSIPDAGLGVFNNSDTIPVGAHFGPYQGDTVDREEAMNSSYSWVIHKSEQSEKYIDATSELHSNWMRYVNCARNDEEQNLVAFQYRGGILYRCCRPIGPGHELLLWYEEEFAKDLHSFTFNYIWSRKCSVNGTNTILQVFSCSSCPLSYTSKSYLHKHIKRCHHEEYVRLLKSGEIKYESLVASKSSSQSAAVCVDGLDADSPRMQTQKAPLQCSECGKNFIQRKHLKVHQRVHTGEKPYQCSQCGKTFTQRSSLQLHQRLHTRENLCQCSQCGKSFTQQIHLQAHQRIHTGEKPYQCSQCGKSFSEKGSLRRHQNIHTGEKPYHCLQCGKSFSELGTLTRHQRIHTGEKPYQCSHCGKSFSERGNLRTHQRIHTEEKLYHCAQCGKSFTHQSTLQQHQRIHTGEKPYCCTVCGKSFTQHGSFQKHQRIHTGDKPYYCSVCGKHFTQQGNFQKHQRIHT